jgi:hypothetical protein
MGTTKPQLFAIQNEETPAPDSGGDDPPSGEHASGAHDTIVDRGKQTQPDGTVVPGKMAPEKPGTGFMRPIEDRPKSNLTDADHKNGVKRWEIAKLSEQEWRRALANNDREIAAEEPGSPEFARLMESRHRLALPPPKGVKYDDISRYHAEQVRKELEATMPRKPRFDRRRLLLFIGFLALLSFFVIVVLPLLQNGPAPAPTGTPAVAVTATQKSAPTADQKPPQVPPTAETAVTPSTAQPETSAVAAPPTTTKPSGPAAKSATTAATQAPTATTAPPSSTTAAPPSSNTPYFLPKPKSP